MNGMFWFVGVEGEGEQHHRHHHHDQAEEEKDGARSAICYLRLVILFTNYFSITLLGAEQVGQRVQGRLHHRGLDDQPEGERDEEVQPLLHH